MHLQITIIIIISSQSYISKVAATPPTISRGPVPPNVNTTEGTTMAALNCAKLVCGNSQTRDQHSKLLKLDERRPQLEREKEIKKETGRNQTSSEPRRIQLYLCTHTATRQCQSKAAVAFMAALPDLESNLMDGTTICDGMRN